MKFYFFNIRFSAIILVIAIMLDCELFFFICNLFFFHLISGLISIFDDYIHVKKIKIFLVFLNKILFLGLVGVFIEFFF